MSNMSVHGLKPPVQKLQTKNINGQGVVPPQANNVPNYSAAAYQGGFPKPKK